MKCHHATPSLPPLKGPWRVIKCDWGGWPVGECRDRAGRYVVSEWFCVNKCEVKHGMATMARGNSQRS